MRKLGALVIAIFVGLAFGWLSAKHMLGRVALAAPVANSGWNEIRIGGDSLSTLYRTGHFLARGQVPPPADVRMFTRDTDDEGNTLRGDCVVLVAGKLAASRWWFVGAENAGGIATLSAGHVVREADGEVNVSISRRPTAGNWLVPLSDGSYVLQFIVHDAADDGAELALHLPTVKRLWC